MDRYNHEGSFLDTSKNGLVSSYLTYNKKSGLARQLRDVNGEVICKCNGTFDKVMQCLANSVDVMKLSDGSDNPDILELGAKMAKTCSNNGLARSIYKK